MPIKGSCHCGNTQFEVSEAPAGVTRCTCSLCSKRGALWAYYKPAQFRLTSPPENGKVTVKKAMVTATNYKQCLALEVPAFIAFYRSRADFVGVDVLTLGVKFPNGKTQVQRISVTVGSGAPGRST